LLNKVQHNADGGCLFGKNGQGGVTLAVLLRQEGANNLDASRDLKS
jgi:hypothetical protein